MNILLTKNGYILVDSKSEYLVNDEVFLGFIKSARLRNEFLNTIDRKAIVVGRLGKQIKPSVYNNERIIIKEASIGTFVKEVGYYAKL